MMNEDRDISHHEDQLKKMFIGGLSPDTTDENLKSFYEQWGEVADCVVMKDKNTGRSKCFGFITYKESDTVDRCMAERPHVIDGKQVDTKRSVSRHDARRSESLQCVNKAFVGGIRDPLNEHMLREYFSAFGSIVSLDMITDRTTGKSKGFCFITYDDSDSVDKIVQLKNHAIMGVGVEVKKPMSRNNRDSAPGRPRNQETRHHRDERPQGRDRERRRDYNNDDRRRGNGEGQARRYDDNRRQNYQRSYQDSETASFGSGYRNSGHVGAMKNNRRPRNAGGPYEQRGQPARGNHRSQDRYGQPRFGEDLTQSSYYHTSPVQNSRRGFARDYYADPGQESYGNPVQNLLGSAVQNLLGNPTYNSPGNFSSENYGYRTSNDHENLVGGQLAVSQNSNSTEAYGYSRPTSGNSYNAYMNNY